MSAALLAKLIEAGTPAELVAQVAMELARAQAATDIIEQRRAKDRERKRRISTDSTESAEIQSDPAPNKSPPDPQKLTPTPHTHGTGARKADPFPRPEWADRQVWSDLLANRRKKNLANTPSAHRKLLADVQKLVDDDWPPGRVLEAAVSRGWGAIYASCKDEDDGRQNGSNRRSGGRMGGPGPDPTLAIVRSAIAAQREDGRNYG